MTQEKQKKTKVTYTLFVNDSETPGEIQRKLLARRIRVLTVMQGQNMSEWANALGITPQAVYHVVAGRRGTPRIRLFIEDRLGQKIWDDADATVQENGVA